MSLLWEPHRASKFIQRFSHLSCFKESKHKPLGQQCVCNLKAISSSEDPKDLKNKVYLKKARLEKLFGHFSSSRLNDNFKKT